MNLVLAAALLVMVGYGVMWIAYIGIRYPARQWLVRMLDPESWPEGPLTQAIGSAIHHRVSLRVVTPPSINRDPFQQVIESPFGPYLLADRIGQGDVCEVHRAVWRDRELVLKVPRVASCDHLLEREQDVLRDLHATRNADHYGKFFPIPVHQFRHHGRLVSSMECRKGLHSAEQIRAQYTGGVDGRHMAWMFNRLLEALGHVHRSGWIHGAVLPPHLLFDTGAHGLQLIGWVHATPSHSPLKFASRRYLDWYPPECARRRAATPATDLFLAARCMIWMAGGDHRNLSSIPSLHGGGDTWRITSLLRQCLDPDAARRPNDAWELHEQLRELWEAIYGPPKFVHLDLS